MHREKVRKLSKIKGSKIKGEANNYARTHPHTRTHTKTHLPAI